MATYLPEDAKADADAIFGSLVVAKGYDVGTPVRDAINESYRSSMRLIAIVATGFMVPMLVLMFFIKPVRLDQQDKENEETEAEVARN